MKEILTRSTFDIDRDLDILGKKKAEDPLDPYTTQNTMLSLNFNKKDVFDELLKLEAIEYLETILDDKDSTLPSFYAFGKSVQNQEVYIKVKIRDRKNGKIFCVSFHFARYSFPANRPCK